MKRHRINGQIQASEVRIIDDEGRELGVLPVSEALKLVSVSVMNVLLSVLLKNAE